MHGSVMGDCGRKMHSSVMGDENIVLITVWVPIKQTRLLLIGGEIRNTLGVPELGLAAKW